MMSNLTRAAFLHTAAIFADARKSERGAALVEYSLLIVLIAVVAISAIALFGDAVSEDFEGITSEIDFATSS